MSIWLVFKVLHVGAILLGVGLSLGTEILLYRIARSKEVATIRAGFSLAAPLLQAAPAMYLLGLVMGLLTVWAGGWSFVAPWLVISYAIFLLMIFLNLRFRGPWVRRVLTAARESADQQASAALRATLTDPRGEIHMWAAPVATLAQVFLMIVKPFG
jgi:uncharacterized membrane protein